MEYPKKISEVVGHDLVEVFTQDGVRNIWFLGRGFRDKSAKTGFSWLHYMHNIVPLFIVLADPDLDGERCNRLYNYGVDPEIEALDVFTLQYYYSDADTEKPIPFFEYREDIEDGYYIMKGVRS